MNKSDKSSKEPNSKEKTLSFREFIELETLRHKIFHCTLNFSPVLVRGYLESKAGKDLEEKIFTAIG